MRSKDIEKFYNDKAREKKIDITLKYVPEKNPDAKSRYFEYIHTASNTSIGNQLLTSIGKGKYNVKATIGPDADVVLYLLWEKDKIKFQCAQQSELKDETYEKIKEWVTATDILGPLFLLLNNITYDDLHNNVNPILKDLPFFKGKKYMDFNICAELRFDTLTEFFTFYNIKSPKLKQLILDTSLDIDKFLKLCGLFKFLMERDIDINYILNHFNTLVAFKDIGDITKFKFVNKDNFKRFCGDIITEKEKGTLKNFYAELQDIDNFEKRLRDLNCRIEFPKVDTFRGYHHKLVEMIQIEEEKLESAPYEWTDAEKILDGFTAAPYVIKLPKSKPDLRRWGTLQKHCIGGYNFTGAVKLISIWKQDGEELNINSCMELNRNSNNTYTERQHRGRFNGDPMIPSEQMKLIMEAINECYNPKPKPKKGSVEELLGERDEDLVDALYEVVR